MTTSDKISLVFNEREAKLYVDGLILLAAIVNNDSNATDKAVQDIITAMNTGEYTLDNLTTLLKQVDVIANHFIRRSFETIDKPPTS